MKSSWPESIAARDPPSLKSLKLYENLKKAESSVLFQARIGRIGLRRFLATAHVPGILPECLCGKGVETVEHFLLYCRNNPNRKWPVGARFSRLASDPNTTSQIARQLIQSGKLGQFSLANRLLYK